MLCCLLLSHYTQDGTSVVANNPDGASDAGQFAIVDGFVQPGKSQVSVYVVLYAHAMPRQACVVTSP